MSSVKDKIYQSTLELISERGFHDAPISKIAKHADISPGSIYNHFQNKDDLLSKLYLEIKEKLGNAVMHEIDFTHDPRTVLRKAWMSTIEFYSTNMHEIDFARYFENTPLAEKVGENNFYEIINPLVQYIEELKQKKIIRNLPILVIALMVFDFASNLADYHVKKKISLNETILEETFQSVWNGLKLQYT